MIACGEAEGGSPSPAGAFVQACPRPVACAPVWRRGRQPDHRHRDLSQRCPVGDIHLRLTRITPTISSSPTTTHEAATPTRSTSPAHRSPPTAAPPSLASPRPTVKALSTIPLVTRLFCTTSQAARGSPSGWTALAAVRASAGYKSTTPWDPPQLAGPISAFTMAAVTTESLASWITTQPLPSPTGCMFPGMTSLRTRRFAPPFSTDGGIDLVRPCQRHRYLHPQRPDHRRQGQRRRLHRRHGRDGWGPHQPGQQDLPLHRRRRDLGQHLHRPHLRWPRAQRFGLLRHHVRQSRRTGGTWAGVSLPPSTR